MGLNSQDEDNTAKNTQSDLQSTQYHTVTYSKQKGASEL